MQFARNRAVRIWSVLTAVLLLPATAAAQGQPAAQNAVPSFRSPTAQELTTTRNASNDWITYGGALNDQRYSTLDQINSGNVAAYG